MATTAAERQRRYRQTRSTADDGEGQRRLNMWVSSKAAIALRRLAAHEGLAQKAVIERLIMDADESNLQSLRSNEDGFKHYLEGSY